MYIFAQLLNENLVCVINRRSFESLYTKVFSFTTKASTPTPDTESKYSALKCNVDNLFRLHWIDSYKTAFVLCFRVTKWFVNSMSFGFSMTQTLRTFWYCSF